MGEAVREETHGAVRHLTLCRPERMNAITPTLRDELADALDAAEHDDGIRVVLLDAEGPASTRSPSPRWPRWPGGASRAAPTSCSTPT